MSIPKQTEVVIIGAGPTGLTTSLLLSRFGIQHLLVEQRTTAGVHPVAHFISTRSMEILREIDGLEATIRAAGAPLKEWRRYVYCTGLYHLPEMAAAEDAPQGSLLGVRDHFPDGPDTKVSPTWECHLPQHRLVALLRDALDEHPQGQLLEAYRADVHDNLERVDFHLTSVDGKEEQRVGCRYAICADGAHGACRKALGIGRSKDAGTRQDFITIHFFSPDLSDLLARRIMGMLYFIYGPSEIGILVNHDSKAGEFVLQLPYFPPHQRPEAYTKSICAQIIERLTGTPITTDIRSVRPWRLGAWVTERFHSSSGRCFIVGDAAHQFLPTSGFGLNCSIADAHNLAWKLALALKQGESSGTPQSEALLMTYTAERRSVAENCLKLSKRNFYKTLAVAAAIGLDWQAARWLVGLLGLLPGPGFVVRSLFGIGMRLALSQMNLLRGDNIVANIRRRKLKRLFEDPNKNMGLRFPLQDLGVIYRQGWIEDGVDTGVESVDKTEYEPAISVGGRLPHFRLQPTSGEDRDTISSLDLPGLVTGNQKQPVHRMLLIDMARKLGRQLARLRAPRYGEIELVRIATSPADAHKADYLLMKDPEGLHPERGAILLRPDGHVAWIW